MERGTGSLLHYAKIKMFNISRRNIITNSYHVEKALVVEFELAALNHRDCIPYGTG